MPPLEFQIMSDLHLETPATLPTYSSFSFERKCANLVLLGDVGLASDERLFSFCERQLRRFDAVFFVPGNHEAYDSTRPTAVARLRAFEARMHAQRQQQQQQQAGVDGALGLFVVLERTRHDVTPELTVLGCTLHSRIDAAQADTVRLFVSDFARTHGWSVAAHDAAHRADLAWLNQQVAQLQHAEPRRAVLIFTHHCPTVQDAAHDPRHLGDAAGVRSAFATDLSEQPCWTAPNVRLWAFGHTHFNCDFIDAATGKRVLANQKGYARREAEGFDAEKVITVSL